MMQQRSWADLREEIAAIAGAAHHEHTGPGWVWGAVADAVLNALPRQLSDVETWEHQVVEALEWYADERNYSDDAPGYAVAGDEGTTWETDNGTRARAVLRSMKARGR